MRGWRSWHHIDGDELLEVLDDGLAKFLKFEGVDIRKFRLVRGIGLLVLYLED